MIVLLAWLFSCVCAQRNFEYPPYPIPGSGQPKLTPEAFERLRAEEKQGFLDNDFDDLNLKEFIPEGRAGNSPRDPLDPLSPGISERESKQRARMWFDFVGSHDTKLRQPSSSARAKQIKIDLDSGPRIPLSKQAEDDRKFKFFMKHTFDLDWAESASNDMNRTTCDEFKQGAQFHPEKLIDVYWVAFYVWPPSGFPAPSDSTIVYRFAYVTQKVVQVYRLNFGQYLNSTIDWIKPKMLLREDGPFQRESLLIAGDQSGLFYLIPNIDLSDYVKKNNITLPLVSVRFKLVNKYLVVMYCDDLFSAMFAPKGSEPKTNEKKVDVAASAGLRGKGQPVDLVLGDPFRMANSQMPIDTDRITQRKPEGMFPSPDQPPVRPNVPHPGGRRRHNRVRPSEYEDQEGY